MPDEPLGPPARSAGRSPARRSPAGRLPPADAEPTPATRVRPAAPADLPALAELAALTFPLACPASIGPADAAAFIASRLSREAFAAHLAEPSHRVLVATDDDGGPLIGYTLLILGEPADADAAAAVTIRPTVELSKCYVHPVHHGTGTAAALMGASLAAARGLGAGSVWLGVNQHNSRAQRFYAKNGFTVAATKHFTVGTVREDDYVMTRAL